MGIQRTVKRLGHLSALALLVSLAGCIQSPVLLVSPLALSIDADQQNATFRIQNPGAAMLEWTASENLPWLSLRQSGTIPADTIAGTTATAEVDVIELVVDRTGLPLGISTGVITITSNAGTQTMNVSVTETRPALLQLSDTNVDFGVSSTQSAVFVSNGGVDPLNWSAEVSANAPWLTITPDQGTLNTAGDFESVNLTVDRANLAANDFFGTITFTSNGGTGTVDVSMTVPPFNATPSSIDFGVIGAPQSSGITINSNAFTDINVNITTTTSDGANWLTVDTASGTVPAAGSLSAGLTVDPAGLLPGDYTGNIVITNVLDGFAITVPISMTINQLQVSPTLIDFGENLAVSQDTINIVNLDSTSIAFEVSVPATANWLSVDPLEGTVTNNTTLIVTIDRDAVGPGSFEAPISITYPGGSSVVTVRMANPKPAELKVEPREIDLAATRNSELIGIWNDGIGTVDYRIDSNDFPAWLTISPEGAGAITTGSLSGAQTDAYTLSVDRSLAPAGQVQFEHTFTVEASGDATNDIDVTVKMEVPLIPVFELIADGVDENGDSFVNFDTDEDTRTIIVRNNGTGVLQWSIAVDALPQWITSVQPASGSLDPGRQETITLAVDRSTLSFLGAQAELFFTTNDPDAETVPLIVEIQVPKVVEIGARPGAIAFGLTDTSDVLEVANFGDPDTILNYRISSSKEWLAVFPSTGSSVGTFSSLKDFKAHSVTVDRSLLDGDGASGVLTITAFTIEDGEPVPLDGVESLDIPVSVEAAQLTIETALPRLRIPSLVRFVLLMRNIRFQALPLPDSRLDEVKELLAVFENEQLLDGDETNKFMQPIERARTNALILLDYSGSMQQAARDVADTSISEAADPIQALYERTISTLIDELPANYKVGIAVFNDRRSGDFRPILGGVGEPANIQDELFIRDKNFLKQRLQSIVVEDNGATSLAPAIQEAVRVLAREDRRRNFFPFDDADVRALITVTDGRLTTPPGVINDIVEPMFFSGTRFFCIGWGNDVNADVLIRATTETGGHFYATRNEPTGAVDAFGAPIRIPVVDTLEDWTTTDPFDECDLSLAKDFDAQVIFSYVSLNESSNVNFEGRLTFDDPNDQNSICIDEQGEITGSFSKDSLNFEDIAGDPRLGQISLFSEGVQPDNSAEVIVRLEGSPRNIGEFSFQMSINGADALQRDDVLQVTRTQGGVIDNWNASGAGNTFTYQTPDDPLFYGEFGDLLRINVSNVVGGNFTLFFEVLSPTIGDDNTKYITHPDTITVGSDEFLASAFPNPFISGNPAPTSDEEGLLTFDLGTAIDQLDLSIFNLGGSHDPTDVRLLWELQGGNNANVLFFDPDNLDGELVSTLETDTTTILVDRNLEPGDYEAEFTLEFLYGSLGIEFETEPITILFTITPPDFEVSTNLIELGVAGNDFQLDLSNVGQSIVNWDSVNFANFPIWLDITQTLGTLTAGDTDPIRVRVDRTTVPPGDYSFTMVFNGLETNENELVTVTMTVP